MNELLFYTFSIEICFSLKKRKFIESPLYINILMIFIVNYVPIRLKLFFIFRSGSAARPSSVTDNLRGKW